jgi:outer membrane protein assembly factor BamB
MRMYRAVSPRTWGESPWRICSVLLLACGMFTGLHGGAVLQAGDWPQILGPNRDGIAAEKALRLLPGGESPRVAWRRPAGSGVAGVAVRSGQVLLFHRVEDEEIAVSLAAETGQEQWTQRFPATFQPRIMPDNGPLCVPVLLEEYVLLHGATGQLHCLARETGKVLWSVNTHEDFRTDEGYFGAGSSPLVVGDKVLVNVGGARQEAGVVAFDLKSGRVVWKAGGWQASYSSPVLAKVENEQLAIVVTRLETVGLEPDTGKVRFSLPFGQRGPTVNGANPLVIDGHLFLTASYGIGNVWAKLHPDKIEVLREDLKPLASQYTTPIVVGRHLIGIDGRQDGGPVDLVCCDPVTGQDAWRIEDFGYATLIRVGEHLLIMKTEGELVIAEANVQEFRELREYQLSDSICRALPAFAHGRLFLRNEQELICYQLQPE